MSTPKVNAWYGWLPDRPDFRDKLYAAIAGAGIKDAAMDRASDTQMKGWRRRQDG